MNLGLCTTAHKTSGCDVADDVHMQLGIGPFTCQIPPSSDQSVDEVLEETLTYCERAEASGFDSVWLTEHHNTDDGYLPSPIPLAAAIADRTDTLDVGTGVALAPFYQPLRLAEDVALVDNLCSRGGGQFRLGMGLGYRDVEFETFGISKRERVGRLLDTVEICRSAWNDGALDGGGRFVEYPRHDVRPKPKSDVPILIGASSDPAIERTGRVGDGYLAPMDLSVDKLQAKLSLLEQTLIEENRDPSSFDVSVFRLGFVHEDGGEAAWETIREPYLYQRKKYLEWFAESEDSDVELSSDDVESRASELEDVWRSWTVCGTPDDWIAELERLADCWQFDVDVNVQLHYPGMEADEVHRAIDLFGESIIPDVEAL